MIYYFAYGSNTNKEDLEKWCKKTKQKVILRNLVKYLLRGYNLEFRGHSEARRGGVATIHKMVGGEVWGVIYQTDEKSLDSLDIKEGEKYKRIGLKIFLNKKEETVIVYIMKKNKINRPNKEYIKIIIEGLRKHEISQKYLRILKNIETNEIN